MDAIKARIEKAAKKKLEEAKDKLKKALLKALGLPKVIIYLRIECIFLQFNWHVKAWTEAHFV